jgi:hypothetical protein
MKYINAVGSKTFDGVWFTSYSHDHFPPHVHGEYGETSVVVDLLADGKIRQSRRNDAIRPSSAKRSDVRRILRLAAENANELKKLWETTHGKAS